MINKTIRRISLFLIPLLILQLFAMECLAEVPSPVVVSSQESSGEKVTAVERVENIANEIKTNRQRDGRIDLLAGGLLTLIEFSYVNGHAKGFEAISLFIDPIYWFLGVGIFHYLSKGIFFIVTPTHIEQDYTILQKTTFSNDFKKEEAAINILKENANKEQEVKWVAFYYKDIQFIFPKLHSDISNKEIEKNHLEYLGEKQTLK